VSGGKYPRRRVEIDASRASMSRILANTETFMSSGADSLKTIFYALGANLAIFATKAVAAVMTGSGAMFAEAVHSLADCANQGCCCSA
jgi:Co/Zn/Cd efflux system component